MEYTLHVGLHPDHVGDLGTDGDHWEQWGEPRPAGEAVHATWEVDTLADGLRALASIADSGRELVPMLEDHQRGTVAAITYTDDWSALVIDITINL